jgi:hypothetical protein
MRIAVLQFYDRRFKELSDISAPVHEAWCKRRGYTYIREQIDDFRGRHPCWTKLWLIQEHLPKFDWAFYLDTDALVTDPEFDLSNIIRFIEADRVMAVSEDANGMNAGVLLVKRCPWTTALFDAISIISEDKVQGGFNDQLGEQRTLERGISEFLGWSRCARFAQRTFNSYLYDLYGDRYHYPQGEWCFGDPVLHLPGVDMETRKKIFTQFINELHL